MSKVRRLKCKRFFLYVFGFIFSIAPLGSILIYNADEYIATVKDAVKLSFGGVLVVIFIVLKVLGKLKIPRRITGLAIAFVMCYLFASVLHDLLLLTGAVLAGEVIDYEIFQPWIGRVSKRILLEESAEVTADKIEETLTRVLGGRV